MTTKMSPCDWSFLTLAFGIMLITMSCRAKIIGSVKEFKFFSILISIIGPLFLFLGVYFLLRSNFVEHEKIGIALIFTALALIRILTVLENLVNKK